MTNWTDWLLVFIAIFLADVFWVLCVNRVQASKPIAAGLWAVALFLPTALVTMSYVKDPVLLIPACIGGFAGTALTVLWERKRKENELNKLVNQISPDNIHSY
jgi:hypothetical protein